jgi:hypothetical protein
MAADLGGNGTPLVDSRGDFAQQCHALIASKQYNCGGVS